MQWISVQAVIFHLVPTRPTQGVSQLDNSELYKTEYWNILFCCFFNKTVCRKPYKFSLNLSNAVVTTVKVKINAIRFIVFEADVRTFEIRTLRNLSVTKIGYTLSCNFSADWKQIYCHSILCICIRSGNIMFFGEKEIRFIKWKTRGQL